MFYNSRTQAMKAHAHTHTHTVVSPAMKIDLLPIGLKTNLISFSSWDTYLFVVIIFPVKNKIRKRKIKLKNTDADFVYNPEKLPCI